MQQRAYFVPNAIDPDGEIKRINEKEVAPDPPCRGERYGRSFDWELDNESFSGGGYIVQHVKVTCEIRDCSICTPCPKEGEGNSDELWEAWPLAEDTELNALEIKVGTKKTKVFNQGITPPDSGYMSSFRVLVEHMYDPQEGNGYLV